MLGASTAGLTTPAALGYARHVARAGVAPVLGRAALALAGIDALAALVLAAGWAWNRFV